MPVRLHHIVVDAHDLPGLARFWTQALGWKSFSERDREIVIGTGEIAPVGMCFMPVADPKIVKNRVHLGLTTSAQDRDQEIERLLALGARRVDIGQTGQSPGRCWPTLRETSSAWCARRERSPGKAEQSERPQSAARSGRLRGRQALPCQARHEHQVPGAESPGRLRRFINGL